MRKLSFFFICSCFCFFCFSFVSEGHILSNSSNLKWSDAFMGRSAKFPFKAKFSFLCLCLFLCFSLGFLTSLYYLWTHWSAFCVCFVSHLVLWSSFIHLVWGGTENWIGTSCSLERKNALHFYFQICLFISGSFHLKTQTSSALHLNMMPISMCLWFYSTV